MISRIGSDINKAAKILAEGGVVAIPTETVYGLAANALDDKSVARIFEIKKRPQFDPLIVHLAPHQDINVYVENVPSKALELMGQFWPGPLTLVLPKKNIIPDLVTSGLDTVGIRKPSHEITQDLLKKLDFPLAAPSANLFGRVSPTKPIHVLEQLGDKVDYILDGGDSSVGVESSIVGWDDNNPVLYRHGGIPVEQIQKICPNLVIKTHSTSNPAAPGMLTNHYSPDVQLVIGEPNRAIWKPGEGILRFDSKSPDFPEDSQLVLSDTSNLNEAARNLFSSLRLLDDMGFSKVYVQLVPDKGLGKAINDRLNRASTE